MEEMIKSNVYKLGVVALIFFGLIGVLFIPAHVKNDKPEVFQENAIYPSPSSAKILFVSNRDTGTRAREIYAMNGDGTGITRITYSNFHHRILGIDRTKRYIVATCIERDSAPPAGLGDEDRKSIWLIDLQTGDEKRLTDPEDNAEGDSFSPDGKWIVFHMTRAGESQADIYKIRTDGTELTRLTQTYYATESDPEWSNDGQKIAFVSYSAQTGRFVLKIMDADGGNVSTIYDPEDAVSTPYFKEGVYDPSWSPDDQWIVFEKPVHYSGENGNAGVWHIFKIHPDDTGLMDLSENGGHTDMAEYLPSFSSDGRKIIFSARYGSPDPADVNIDIFIMNSDGTSPKKITNGKSYNEFGVWIR